MRRKREVYQKRIYSWGENEIGYEEKKRDKPKTNLQANIQERSHLEGGQESKLVDAQTKLQPKPNQTSSNVTCKHSCSLAKMQTRRRIERETKRMKRNEEKESYL